MPLSFSKLYNFSVNHRARSESVKSFGMCKKWQEILLQDFRDLFFSSILMTLTLWVFQPRKQPQHWTSGVGDWHQTTSNREFQTPENLFHQEKYSKENTKAEVVSFLAHLLLQFETQGSLESFSLNAFCKNLREKKSAYWNKFSKNGRVRVIHYILTGVIWKFFTCLRHQAKRQ